MKNEATISGFRVKFRLPGTQGWWYLGPYVSATTDWRHALWYGNRQMAEQARIPNGDWEVRIVPAQ